MNQNDWAGRIYRTIKQLFFFSGDIRNSDAVVIDDITMKYG